MKKNLSVIAILLLAVVAIFLFRNYHWLQNATATPPAPAENSSAAPGNSAHAPASADATSPNDLSAHAASPNPPDTNAIQTLAPLTVLDNARVAMHNYGSTFGENPVGENAEITAALMGNNPKQINFFKPESGLRVNDKGEMVDAYGTPFFFHQLSGQEMEIRSAGEDRKMWTFDDQVTR